MSQSNISFTFYMHARNIAPKGLKKQFLLWTKLEPTFPKQIEDWSQLRDYLYKQEMNDETLEVAKWFWDRYCYYIKRNGSRTKKERL